MKKTFLLLSITAIATLMIACGGSSTNKTNAETQDTVKKANATAENLKAALLGETTASAKYLAFAQKAKEENLPVIAALFSAAAKSEEIHANNHKKVLLEMGQTAEVKADTFSVKTTKENLQAAFSGEKYEVDNMYPGFIEQADTDENDKAVKSFTWAVETEKKHMVYFTAAMDALTKNTIKSLPPTYFVCPKCGFIYNNKDQADACELCMTDKEAYITFK